MMQSVEQQYAVKPVPQRNSTIDIAKGLMILLVVFAHNPLLLQYESELQRVIFSFPLALFFLVTGFFLKADTPMPAFVRSRASSLLKPFFVVLLALAVMKVAKQVVLSPEGENPLSLKYFAGILYGTGPTIDWTPLWFLPSLFVTSVFSLVMLKLIGKRPWIIVALATALIAIGATVVSHFWSGGLCTEPGKAVAILPGLPWSLDLLPITASFMLIGYVLGPWAKSFEFNALGFVFSLAVFAAMHVFFNETMDLNCRIYGNLFVSTIQAYAGSYLALCVSSLLGRIPVCRALLTYIGTGTIFILLFHGYIESTSIRVLSVYLASPYVIAALSFLAASLGPLVIMEITKRSALLSAALLPRQPQRQRENRPVGDAAG